VAAPGEIAYALCSGRQGGVQYKLLRESLDRLYNVRLDLTLVTVDDGDEKWIASKRRRVLPELTVHERVNGDLMRATSTVELRGPVVGGAAGRAHRGGDPLAGAARSERHRQARGGLAVGPQR
jgi:hypothetical protein